MINCSDGGYLGIRKRYAVLVVNLLLQTKATTYAEFRRPIWEIDDVVFILPHNPGCQPDVRQLFDDTSAAKLSEDDIMRIIVEESEQFPLSSPSR